MKKFFKWTGIVVSIPLILFVVLCIIIYIPPVQNFLVGKAMVVASDATGMDIRLKRLSLSFPLDIVVHDAVVKQDTDTLLNVNKLTIGIQMWPLVKKQVEIDGIRLQNAMVNTMDMVDGMKLMGNVGDFFVTSHGVHLAHETAVVNELKLADSQVFLCLTDTTAADTAQSEPLFWRLLLEDIAIHNVSFMLDMPLDSMATGLSVGNASLKNGTIDLHTMGVTADHFSMTGGKAQFSSGLSVSVENEFNASAVEVNDINISVDSIFYEGNHIRADISQLQMKERSGLQIVSAQGRLRADDKEIQIPRLTMNTSQSVISMEGKIDWTVATDTEGAIRLSLDADLHKDDMFKFVSGMEKDVMSVIPDGPFRLSTRIGGSVNNLSLDTLILGIDQVMKVGMNGYIRNVLDTARREADINLDAKFHNMSFMKQITGGILVPPGTSLTANVNLVGNEVEAGMDLTEGKGSMQMQASYHLLHDKYMATTTIDGIDISHFMPGDSLYGIAAHMKVDGQGTDFFSRSTSMNIDAALQYLRYGAKTFSGLTLHGGHANGKTSLTACVRNSMMDISSQLDAALDSMRINGSLNTDIHNLDLMAIGIADTPAETTMKIAVSADTDMDSRHKLGIRMSDIAFHTNGKRIKTRDVNAGAVLTNDSLKSFINSGDLSLLFGLDESIDKFLSGVDLLTASLGEQLKVRTLDHDRIKSLLPKAHFRIMAGKNNILAHVMKANDMEFNKLDFKISSSPEQGLDGGAQLYGLKLGETRLDTIFMTTSQDAQGLKLSSGVIVKQTPQQEAFGLSVTGGMDSRKANLLMEYVNGRKEVGTQIGVEAYMYDHGMGLTLAPFHPILSYRTFSVNPDNYIYLSDEGRLHANLKLYDGKSTSMHIYSTPDSLSQQDISVDMRGLNIGELRRVVPYMPDITGLIDIDAHYVQMDDMPNLSVEVGANSLTYNKEKLGNWGVSAVYLPTDDGNHHADGYVTINDREVLALNGVYTPATGETLTDAIKAGVEVIQFPMDVANAFVPDKMLSLSGNVDGSMDVRGNTSDPVINGTLNLNDVKVYVPQISQTLRFDNKAITMRNNLLTFNNLNIYTGGKTPFAIDGYVDMMKMEMDMKMFAENFELINAKRSRESVAYGKLFVDLDSSIKGSLDELKMNGNLRILGNSDVTYIMQESPLTVEDRLSENVTFVNFSDTTQTIRRKLPELTLGGLDMLMNMHIDEGVQCMIDLNDDAENYMKFEGGGDLAFQYHPDGTMQLNGRYTLLSGEMKYAISLISKTFKIQNGSFIEWTGNVMNPNMNIKAMERVRAAVAQDENTTRNVNFDVGVQITNRLEDMGFTFTLEAPDDGTMQNELAAMSDSEKNKVAVTMLVTSMYMSDNGSAGGMSSNTALNSLLQSEINKLAGSAIKTVDINLGMESANDENGNSGTNYNFQLAKRFWNNRFRVVIGGKISTGNNASNQDESFIDNISLEYRLDNSGTRYVKLFHEKNYESILDGEVVQTGAGIVLRKKVSKIGDLFIFRRKKKGEMKPIDN